jgi:ribosomal protein L11 methyltransferase
MSRKFADPDVGWFEIVVPTHSERLDLLTAALAEAGYPATEVREPTPAMAEIIVYVEAAGLEAARVEAARVAAAARLPDPGDVVVRPSLGVEVWTENWRHHFRPVRVGRRWLIVPPWEADALPDTIVLVINPGAAFGTGQHETTALCLAALEDLVKPGMRVADIGSGSGILAIAAAKLGAARVLATDIETAAIQAIHENAVANGVADRIDAVEVTAAGPCVPNDETYDVIVANIYADTLAARAGEIAGHLAPGGHLVLSGIEAARTAVVESAFECLGFGPATRCTQGEWVALVFARATA